MIIWGFVSLVCFVSCCFFPYCIPSESIRYNHSRDVDTLYYEANTFYNSPYRCHIFQAIKTNTSTTLAPANIVVSQNGTPLKFKVYQALPHQWKKIKQTTSLPKQSLILISTKVKRINNDSILIVERNYPVRGDSIVVSVKLDEKRALTAGIFGRDSEAGKMLPIARSLESDANRYALEMMMQMQKDSIK